VNPSGRKIWFGKYKGRSLGSIKTEYLVWLSHNLDEEKFAGNKGLKVDIEKTLKIRHGSIEKAEKKAVSKAGLWAVTKVVDE